MRKIVLRALLVGIVPLSLGIAAGPDASAKAGIPDGCDIFNNTHCHCLSPRGLMECMIID